MSKWVKVTAAVIAAVAVVILAYAVLTPEENATDGTDHMGMNGHMSYSSGNVGLIALSAVVIVVTLMFMLLWKEYEPLPPSMAPPRPPAVSGTRAEERPGASASFEERKALSSSEDAAAGRDYLVLRLLTGDERTMFKTLMDLGGEGLQKDLIIRTKMSNAKVSRVLDRLEQKGVISKERFGATNKIKIRRET